MKTYIFSLGFMVLASCNRVPEVQESRGQQVALVSSTTPTSPADVAEVAPSDVAKVIPPVNAPTQPGTPTPTMADIRREHPELGSNLAPPPAARGALARAGLAVPQCKPGPGLECKDHADCQASQACICRPDGGYSNCVPADCRTDADCGGGSCVETLERAEKDLTCATARVSLHCSSAKDECKPGAGSCGDSPDHSCIFDTDTKRFMCASLCTEMPMMRTVAD